MGRVILKEFSMIKLVSTAKCVSLIKEKCCVLLRILCNLIFEWFNFLKNVGFINLLE